MPHKHQNNCFTTLVRPLLEYSSSVWNTHTQTLTNQIEMVQRRAACFCLNDYTSREANCVSEMLKQLHIQQLITRRTNKRLTILHKAICEHLSLPVTNLLQPVRRLSKHLNNNTFNTIHASKNCYNFSYFPRTIRYWNFLSDV